MGRGGKIGKCRGDYVRGEERGGEMKGVEGAKVYL